MSRSAKHQGRSFARQLELLNGRLQQLQERKFYGRVTLDMCAGNIMQARIEESWKLQEEADGESDQEACKDGRQDQKAAASS